MKYHIIIFLLGITLFFGCEEDEHKPYGSDGIAPGPVTIDKVINTPGGAVIYFTAPTDNDVLYVKATFEDNLGNKREVKTSAVMDSLNIEGYGEMGEYPVSVYAVDRGENVSSAVNISISPLEPPVQLILPTIVGEVDYGGIKIHYENLLQAEVSLNLVAYDSIQDQMVYRESFFTSQPSGFYSFRGYKSEKTRFGVYVEDRWGNQSETVNFEVIPIPDEFLEKSLFSVFKISGDKSFNEYGFNTRQMWDGRWSDQWNCGHTNFEPLPHRLTIDLGTTAKLSRFKLYQRGGSELYKHGNPKRFKIYGTLDINELPPYDPANPNAGWTLLKECQSFKPSGLPIGQVNSEDIEFQNKGEDFEFDVENLVEVRYIRIENLETWGEQQVTVIGELSFWGEITSTQNN
ncbi:DUF5000 domain-containing lipoprotein [Sunxiuqinia sp. sy24]|uniref:DUF5000 domain-containing lipoprotein n=1 Tax=Sunxiuqinia sp. sy24 TaxID=3461495 RepID=UPI00404686BC